jgi:hypothetical protein
VNEPAEVEQTIQLADTLAVELLSMRLAWVTGGGAIDDLVLDAMWSATGEATADPLLARCAVFELVKIAGVLVQDLATETVRPVSELLGRLPGLLRDCGPPRTPPD